MAYIRLFDSSGRLAVFADSDSINRHKCLLWPIGGVIEATDEGKKTLIDNFKAEPLSFNGNKLDFRLPSAQMTGFQQWLLQGHGLEPQPSRRIFKGVMASTKLLDPRQAGKLSFHPHKVFPPENGSVSGTFIFTYNVGGSATVLSSLMAAQEQPLTLFKFVTPYEIAQSKSGDCSIADIVKFLVE